MAYILVVDDDPAVRGMIRAILEDIGHEIEEAKIRRTADLEGRKENLDAELGEKDKRFEEKQEQEKAQATSDLEVAKQGIEALKLVKEAKSEAKTRDAQLDIDMEKQLLELRGGADMQALLATLDGEQADRLMKLAEMQMREGMTPEKALAFVAEKSPEHFAPAVADVLKAKFGGDSSSTELKE